MLSKNHLFLKISIPVVILAAGIFYYAINPSTSVYTPKCPFHLLTGFHCPGCGSQRAIHEILHGNIWIGLQHNFLILFLIIIASYKAYTSFINESSEKKTENLLQNKVAPWLILALVLGFWILRNIPLEPFQILAP